MYAVASFAAAFAIGYTVQQGDADTEIFAPIDDEKSAEISVDPQSVQLMSASADPVVGLPSTPRVVLESRLPNVPAMLPADRMRDSLRPNPLADSPSYSAYGVECDLTFDSHATEAAMVTISLSASCHPNQKFVVKHGDMLISGQTSSVGFSQINVPAMAALANFELAFEDGQTAQTAVFMKDFANYDRIGLQWQGNSGLEIHALEFGADYGQAGHVWKNAPRSMDFASRSLGGFMTRVGHGIDPQTWHAEVYNFPSGTIRREGSVQLSVETEITPFNCGRDISAQTLQPKSSTGVEVVDLSLTMPDCGAIGDFLVLNNLFRDLKIARN